MAAKCVMSPAIMSDLNYFFNCTVQKDYYSLNFTDNYNDTLIRTRSEVEIVGLGTLTGILIALAIDVALGIIIQFDENGLSPLKTKLTKTLNAKTVLRILVLTILVLFLPFMTVVLLLALLYKVLCSVIIKKRDKNFVGFLDSFDVFWSLEDDATKSIINVLGIIESDSPLAIAKNIKEKLKNVFPNGGTKKIFYRRNEKYGFYYWTKYSSIDIDQYVEIIEFKNKVDDLNEDDLESVMADLQDQTLPYCDEGLFKILITKQRVGNHHKERGNYGIIFRIHHSVGDGVALIEFLCQTFADKTKSYPVNMFALPDTCNNQESPNSIMDMMQKLCQITLCFIDGILRKPDKNTLHGPTLLGKKVFKWTQSDENLLIMVKEIKDNVEQLNFTDILITALSNGLQNYFTETMAPVPEDIAVVIPVRFPRLPGKENELVLQNDFSVTILDIPVKGRDKLKEVKYRCSRLRKSADPLTNHYLLKLMTSVFPRAILQCVLNSSQASLVFSNMPGPGTLSICGGNELKSLVFFVPQKGTTGLGITALCYGGILRLAAMADSAIVSTSEDLALILEGMVDEIRRLHRVYVTK